MSWIVNRLKERSTWSGLLTIAAIAGLKLAPEQKEMIVTVATTIVALIFTFTADKPAEAKTTAKEVVTSEVVTEPDQSIASAELTDEQKQQLANGP